MQSENADVEIRNHKTMAAGKAAPNAAPRRFGTALSVNSNVAAPKGAPMGKAAPVLMSNANAPHLTAENRAEPVARDNVTPGDIVGALDIDQNDRCAPYTARVSRRSRAPSLHAHNWRPRPVRLLCCSLRERALLLGAQRRRAFQLASLPGAARARPSAKQLLTVGAMSAGTTRWR